MRKLPDAHSCPVVKRFDEMHEMPKAFEEAERLTRHIHEQFKGADFFSEAYRTTNFLQKAFGMSGVEELGSRSRTSSKCPGQPC